MTYVNALTALADPTRRRVFERLRDGPRTVGALDAFKAEVDRSTPQTRRRKP
jgi:DNA-binding transcriptional ArsR family regulator